VRTTDDFRFFAWFCALAVFHTPGGVSPPERGFTLHLVFEKSESLLHIVFANNTCKRFPSLQPHRNIYWLDQLASLSALKPTHLWPI